MPVIHPPSNDLKPSETTYTNAYASIVSRARRTTDSGSGGVVIMAGTDVDGVLGARMLCSLLNDDDVPYRLVPVSGVGELEIKCKESLVSEELHTLMLISLGSLLTLTEFFNLPTSVHLHVIDAHRPWNLSNLFDIDFNNDGTEAHGKIWVWGDGEEFSDTMEQLRKSYEALQFGPESDSDDSSNDESEEEAEEEEIQEEEEGPDTEGDEPSRKRRKNDSLSSKPKRDGDGMPRKLPKAAKAAHQDRVARYYDHGTFHGQSVALSIYLLATVLERANNDTLWYSILAVTHQYITSHIDRDQYELYYDLFLDEVVRLNHEPEPGAAKAPDPDNRNISKSEELRFMLYRHWDLYNAMLHSGYVAGRLGIWKEKGRNRLRGLLAKMGYSIQQCNQTWSHMDMELKRQLPEILERVGPEYGLIELTYPSFTRAYGFQLSSISAADAVEVVSSLLDVAVGIRLEVEREGGKGGGEWFGGSTRWVVESKEAERRNSIPEERDEGEDREGEEQGKKDQNWHVTNFWIAYDACDDVSLLRRSLPLAMALHRAIIRAGSDLLDKSVIRTLRNFRLAILSEGPDLKLFTHPSPLSRLALWLVDATRDKWVEKLNKQNLRNGGKVKSLPFVVACLNEEKGTFSVVGITGAPEYGDVKKNKFGLAFEQAADHSNASTSLDMFETSVIEVARDDLQSFIEHLHLHSV
ncbi:hypothetical protein L204_101387 [Cryptococcus depauperatus]